MTRYARAQGSKAANKREEEEATPWSVMVRGIRGSGVVDRRREVSEKNPEDFDETDDIVVADDDDDDDVKQEESEDDDEQDEEEDSGEQKTDNFDLMPTRILIRRHVSLIHISY